MDARATCSNEEHKDVKVMSLSGKVLECNTRMYYRSRRNIWLLQLDRAHVNHYNAHASWVADHFYVT